jgi:hypothetical protein
MSIIPNLDEMTDEDKLKVLESVQQSIRESKEIQKKKIGENVQAVVAALKKIENDINNRFENVAATIENRVANIKDGQDGAPGIDGRPGRDGVAGKDGRDGRDGVDGTKGEDGVAGQDGVSVTNAYLDFDNSLIIELSNGRSINAGEVLPPDIADRLKIIINQGANGAGGGGASLPDQTGNAGKFLTTDGVDASWGTPSGSGDVVGPSSATNNAVARFDGVTGKLIKNSTDATIDNSGNAVFNSAKGNYFSIDTTATPAMVVGRMSWNSPNGTAKLMMVGGNVQTHIGQTIYAYVTNAEATTITKGQAVYLHQASADRPSVKLAYNTGDATSAKTFGLVAESIAAGAQGFVICQGELEDLNTSSYTAGATLYLGATAGTITATKQYAPNHLVYIGVAQKVDATTGIIYVKTQNGYEMDELHNVSAQNPTNGQLLIYNQTTSLWEKANLTAGTNVTITNAAGAITIAASGGGGGTGDGGAYAWFLS